LKFIALVYSSEVLFIKFLLFLAVFVALFFRYIHYIVHGCLQLFPPDLASYGKALPFSSFIRITFAVLCSPSYFP